MIIKIPLRISFIGGGTDFPEFYNNNEGLSISSTFNKYAYITDDIERWEINQNHQDLINAAMTYWNSTKQVSVASDLPPGSGLGTSSAIAVGLTKMLGPYYLATNKRQLAESAIIIEREIAEILGGHQDQYASAYCGTNIFHWNKEQIIIEPLDIDPFFEEHLLLINTKITRFSDNIMKEQINQINNNINLLKHLAELTTLFHKELINKDYQTLGKILTKSWLLKIELSKGITIPEMESFKEAIKNIKSIYGYKLMGAGGGGYILVICKDRNDTAIELASLSYESFKPELVDTHQLVIK